MSGLTVRRCGDVVVLDMPRNLRAAEVDQLREQLTDRRKEGDLKLVLNAKELRRIQEEDMPILIRSLRSFNFVGGKIVLVQTADSVRGVLDRVGVMRHVNAFETEEEGLGFLGSRPNKPANTKAAGKERNNNESESQNAG
mgnify:CR=1 FL=1